jgi:hypothetical protein
MTAIESVRRHNTSFWPRPGCNSVSRLRGRWKAPCIEHQKLPPAVHTRALLHGFPPWTIFSLLGRRSRLRPCVFMNITLAEATRCTPCRLQAEGPAAVNAIQRSHQQSSAARRNLFHRSRASSYHAFFELSERQCGQPRLAASKLQDTPACPASPAAPNDLCCTSSPGRSTSLRP